MMQYLRNNVRWIMVTVVALFVVSCFAGYGMYTRGQGQGQNGMRDYAVAEAGGQKIMRSTLEQGLRDLAEQLGNQQIRSADLPLLRKAVLDNLVVTTQLAREVESQKIAVGDDELKASLKRIQDQFPTKEAYMQYLERSGMKEKDLEARLREQLAQQKLLEKVTASATVDPKDARKLYDSMKDMMFRRPMGYMVNVVTFRKLGVAEEARKKLVAGEKWDQVLGLFSGDIGNSTPYAKPVFIPDRELASDLQVIRTLPEGKLTPLVKITSDDTLLALKRGKEAERVLSFDEVSGDIDQMLLSQEKKELQGQFFEDLKKKAAVTILDPKLFEVEKVSPDAKPVSGE